MQMTLKRLALAANVVALIPLLASLGACGKVASTSATTTSSTATVPAPPGDSTPKPADTMAVPAMPQNERTGTNNPSTVGTASSGSPPYTMQSAPEGNPAPSQGTNPTGPKK